MKIISMFTAIRRHLWGILLALITVFALIKFSSFHIKTKVVPVSQIVISSSAIPKTFNPALIQESPYISDYTHEGLISENYQGKIEPALAEFWKISEDKKRIIFSLRKGLKWSDGQPITTDDVVFTYNEIFLGKDMPNNAYLEWVKIAFFPLYEKSIDCDLNLLYLNPLSHYFGWQNSQYYQSTHCGKQSTQKIKKVSLNFYQLGVLILHPKKLLRMVPIR